MSPSHKFIKSMNHLSASVLLKIDFATSAALCLMAVTLLSRYNKRSGSIFHCPVVFLWASYHQSCQSQSTGRFNILTQSCHHSHHSWPRRPKAHASRQSGLDRNKSTDAMSSTLHPKTPTSPIKPHLIATNFQIVTAIPLPQFPPRLFAFKPADAQSPFAQWNVMMSMST